MIAQELEVSLHMAFVEARQQRHEFITVEHLLLALLDNPSAAEVLRACSANVDDLRKSLANFIKDNTPQVAGSDDVDTQPTLGFQRVIQRAIMHVQSTGSGKKEVTGANVLVAIFGEKDSHAVYYLHQQGVVLAPAAQNLNYPFDLVMPADKRIYLAFFGQLVQIDRVLLQGRRFFVFLAPFFIFSRRFAGFGRLGRVAFLDAVGNEIDHIQARDALLVQVIHRMRVFFAKNGDQHVRASHFLLATAGGLHMHDGALDHALETERGLRIDIVAAGNLRRVVLDEIGKRLAQVIHIG